MASEGATATSKATATQQGAPAADDDRQADQMLGVSFDQSRGAYKARIFFAGQDRYIGRYSSIKEAALAHDQVARHLNSRLEQAAEAEAAAGAAGSGKRKRPRPRSLNFPETVCDDPAVTQRLQAILEAAGAGAQTGAAAAAAAAAAADSSVSGHTQHWSQSWTPAGVPAPSGVLDTAAAGGAGAGSGLSEWLSGSLPLPPLLLSASSATTALQPQGGAVVASPLSEGLQAPSTFPGGAGSMLSAHQVSAVLLQSSRHAQQLLLGTEDPAGGSFCPTQQQQAHQEAAAAAAAVYQGLLPCPADPAAAAAAAAGWQDLYSLSDTPVQRLADTEWEDLLALVGTAGPAAAGDEGCDSSMLQGFCVSTHQRQQQQQLLLRSNSSCASTQQPPAAAGPAAAALQVLLESNDSNTSSSSHAGSLQMRLPSAATAPAMLQLHAGPDSAGTAAGAAEMLGASVGVSREPCSATGVAGWSGAAVKVEADVYSRAVDAAALQASAWGWDPAMAATTAVPLGPQTAWQGSGSAQATGQGIAAAVPAAAGAGAGVGGSGLLACIRAPLPALALVGRLSASIVELRALLLQQQQQGGTVFGVTADWLQAGWYLDALASSGLAATASSAAIAAAVAATKAAAPNPTAPNRLALHFIELLLSVAVHVLSGQGAAAVTSSPAVMLEVLQQLQQGLVAVQGMLAAHAPRGADISCRHLLQVALGAGLGSQSLVSHTLVCLCELL